MSSTPTTITLGEIYETPGLENEDGTAALCEQVNSPADHGDSCTDAEHSSSGVAPATDRISIGTLISECMRSETEGDDELNESLSNMKLERACSTALAAACDDDKTADDSCQCGCDKNDHGCCSCCQDCNGCNECPCKESGKCSCSCCNNNNVGVTCCAEQDKIELSLDQQIQAFEEQLAAMGDQFAPSFTDTDTRAEGPTVIRNSIHSTYSELHNAAAPDLVHKMRLALKDIPEVSE
jgi:hypothetical protein